MRVTRPYLAAVLASLVVTTPAQAQILWKSIDYSGAPLEALDPTFDIAMPGATVAEVRANHVWHLRSALNLAALQCQFEPALRVTDNYNAMLGNHKAELATTFATLTNYFKRTKKPLRAAQSALDTFNTKIISSYSTVRGQLGFCETAGRIGKRALFTPKGSLGTLAVERLQEIRNSLKPFGEQQFQPIMRTFRIVTETPRMDPACWDKNSYLAACGVARWFISVPH